jgi:hypothetical protein
MPQDTDAGGSYSRFNGEGYFRFRDIGNRRSSAVRGGIKKTEQLVSELPVNKRAQANQEN